MRPEGWQGGRRRLPGRGHSMCKGPAEESRLVGLGNSQQAGAERARQMWEMAQAGHIPWATESTLH